MKDSKKNKFKLFKVGDIFLLLITILSITFSVIFYNQPKGEFVEIYQESKLLYKYSINVDKTIEVEGVDRVNNGEYLRKNGLSFLMNVHIKNGTVFVRDSTCRDKLCEKPVISNSNSQIICLPHSVYIKITGKSNFEVMT